MLHFFRKIRHDLIANSKSIKYLKYAIGEIILVVIGILIALSINNWNENQKLLLIEKKLLGEVILGLESDYILINKCIHDHKIYLNSQNIIIDWIKGNQVYNDSLVRHFKHTYWTKLFLPKDAPFESLKEFGFRNITNDQLRDQIAHLYDFVYEQVLFWQSEYKKTSIDYRSTLAEIGFEFLDESDEIALDVQPINPLALKSNKAYLFNLRMTNGTLYLHTNKLINAKREIGKTIKMIEKEMKYN